MLAEHDGCFAYLDDIIIVSKTKKEHVRKFLTIFNKLKSFKFYLQLNKCNFFNSKTIFLGHVIAKDIKRPNPSKV